MIVTMSLHNLVPRLMQKERMSLGTRLVVTILLFACTWSCSYVCVPDSLSLLRMGQDTLRPYSRFTCEENGESREAKGGGREREEGEKRLGWEEGKRKGQTVSKSASLYVYLCFSTRVLHWVAVTVIHVYQLLLQPFHSLMKWIFRWRGRGDKEEERGGGGTRKEEGGERREEGRERRGQGGGEGRRGERNKTDTITW